MAECSLRRQTPEVGATCGKAARVDLCGGRSATSVPTAIVRIASPGMLLKAEPLPHVNCSRSGNERGGYDEAVDYGDAEGTYPYAGGRLALISIFEDRSRMSGSMIVSTY